jgi:hypothetical protein
MRLIHCSTLRLEEFFEPKIPPYAILSHTWDIDEVTFNDFAIMNHWRHKKGAQKILKLCEKAQTHTLEYAWIDTCCIDKCSSAELTEAINSMFRWYKLATYCYVYLSDFDSKSQNASTTFTDSRWFTRGWTLQEMLAPQVVHFHDCNWEYYGSIHDFRVDSDPGLASLISKKTGVPTGVLTKYKLLEAVPVAQKMSWAAHRQTTRQEDEAYCLIGLFNINLPLIYGEGTKAFIRLQEEIIKDKDDLTIFAWEPMTDIHFRGILATSPKEFRNATNIIRITSSINTTPEFTITNKGLRIEISQSRTPQLFLPLNCCYGDGERSSISSRQAKSTLAVSIASIGFRGVYMRDRLSIVENWSHEKFGAHTHIYIVKNITMPKPAKLAEKRSMHLKAKI